MRLGQTKGGPALIHIAVFIWLGDRALLPEACGLVWGGAEFTANVDLCVSRPHGHRYDDGLIVTTYPHSKAGLLPENSSRREEKMGRFCLRKVESRAWRRAKT